MKKTNIFKKSMAALATGCMLTFTSLAQIVPAPPPTNSTGTGYISDVTAVTPGACVQSTINGNNQFWDMAQGNTYSITLSNVTDCANGGTDATMQVIVKSSHTGNVCATATQVSTGVYTFEYTLSTFACATMPILYCTENCSPATGMFAQDLLVGGLGHLRASYFDGSCTKTETDNDCENVCTINTSIVGTSSFCAGGSTQLCAENGTDWEWSNGETTQCITVTEGGEYSVVVHDANGCVGSASTNVAVNDPPVVEIEISNPGPVCEGECVSITASGAKTYVWSPNGETDATIEVCEAGTYSVTGTDASGCASSSNEVTVVINPRPSCDIIEPTLHPVYGLPNNPLSADVDCPAGCNCSYAWSVTSSDNSWVITSGQGTPNIMYTCGNNGTIGSFSLKVTCTQTGCSSNCNLDVSSLAQEHCAYTQGFYGNTNGQASCLGLSAPQAVTQALNVPSCNPIVLGWGTRTLTFGCGDASCITAKLPSGSTASVLPSSATCSTATGTAWLANGRFKNVLVGQALTLAINIRLFPNLGSLKITTMNFTTYEATACVNGNAIPGTGQTFTIPQSVINCLGTSANKVSDLLVLANKKLGNQTICTSCSLADVTAALDAVNRGFDRCRVNSTNTIRVAGTAVTAGAEELQMSTFPNPTTGDATVEFVSNNDSKAVIEIYSLSGSLVARVFDTNVAASTTNRVNISTADMLPGTYFIRLTVDNQSAFTRLVVLGKN